MATDSPLQLGMVGLGRMGANLVRRAMRDGHRCAGTDVNAEVVAGLGAEGMTGATTAAELVSVLEPPRAVWVMVPAGAITERAVTELASLLEPGDTVIDGGNTRYHDDIRRARELSERGIHYVDVGTSGGVFGLERGFCLMVGGEDEAVARLAPLFTSLAPGVTAAVRTPGRAGEPSPAEHGWLHCGPAGAGHFVKMVHNGIEYGLMAAYAEGFNILHHANAGSSGARGRRGDRAARRAGALSLRARRRGDRRGLAPRQRRRVLAPRPDRDGAGRVAVARRIRRARLRLGRRALDVDRGDRVRGTGAGADGGSLRAVLVP